MVRPILDEYTGKGTPLWRWQQRQKKVGKCGRCGWTLKDGRCTECTAYYKAYNVGRKAKRRAQSDGA